MAKIAQKTQPPRELPLAIDDCEQNSPEWFRARLGKITASNFQTILANSEDKKGRTTLLRKLAAEIITGEPAKNYTNAAMERGHTMQPEVLDWYARTRFVDLTKVGFIYNAQVFAGWSPDALCGDDGAVEVKTTEPHLLIGILERGTFPTDHRAQAHGGLWVGRRAWTDLVIYASPKMPKYVARVYRDDVYCQEIANAVEVFNYDLRNLVKKVRGYECI